MLKAIGIAMLAGLVIGGSVIWFVRGREITGLEDSLTAAHERLAGWVKGNEDLSRANARMNTQIDAFRTDWQNSRQEAEQIRATLDGLARQHQREIARILERGRDANLDPAAIALDGLGELERLRCQRTSATAAAC
ncbi:hypothetical protein [Dongia sp.]|uniref:hypothetical protein n=1 Tax=Dongia sp. TaxID=1977262 RepID=UPI0035AE0120